MPPIPSLTTASTLFTSAPLTTITSGSPGQSGSTAPQYILGTGGFLFAVVAIVSVAGYFYHGRGSANAAQKSNTWASLTGLLSSVRNIGSTAASTVATTDWPVYLEDAPDHINMVYAKYFHPTFWNLVECHPATTFAPAIFVEEEAIEDPTADPKPFGSNSSLDMDEDGEDRHGKGSTTERSKNDTKPRVEQVPPYDTSSPTNVNFDSKLIGTTARLGGFLYVPGQEEEELSESSDLGSELDFGSLAYDGIVTAPLATRPSSRRHGMADMGHLADSLKGALAEECEGMVSTVSFQTGLADILELLETEDVLSCTPPQGLETLEVPTTSDNSVETNTISATRPHDLKPRRVILSQQAVDNTPTESMPSTASFDSCDNSEVTSSDVVTLAGSHSSVDLMWKLYDDCWKAVGNTLEDDTASDISHGTQYDRSDAELFESCKPLRLRGTKNDGPMASHCNASVHDSGYDTQSSFSKRQVDFEQRDSDNDISSYGSCDSFQSGSGSIESLEGPDELEDLMSEIYTECLRSANQESTISDWDISGRDSQNDMHCGFRSISPNTREATHQKGPSVAQSILSRYPGDNDSRTLDHDGGFYEGYDDCQDSSTDINTLERSEDHEDLMSQIYAEYLYCSKSAEADTVASKPNLDVVHDDCGDVQLGICDTNALGVPHEGPDLMRRILAELRDPSLDIDARDISEDSDSEYSDDDEEGVASRNSRRDSLESSNSSDCTPDSDVSDEGSIYPLTPPPMSATSVINAPDILDDCTSSPNTPGLHHEVQVVKSSPRLSPLALRRGAYFIDPFLDCRPRDLSGDTYCDTTEEESDIQRLRLPQGPHNERRGSLDCTSSNTAIDSDVSNKGPTCPLSPLSTPPDVRKGRISLDLAQEVQVISPFSFHSPPALPMRAHIPRASHRNSRSAMYGPRLPLQDLPRI